MRALFRTAALVFALLVASSAKGSAPSPSVVTKWTVPIPSSAQVALVAQDIVFFSYQTQTGGEYNNTVQAATSNHSSLWTMVSLGLVQSYTTAYAFPTIPKLIFLLVNNIQPPNVSAVVPSSGAVVWSTPAAFEATQGGSLVASVDGSTLYLFTPSPGGTTQLTAFDSGSGEVLFAESEPLPYFQPLQCGSFSSGCFANWTSNEQEATFFDGRSGALLGSVPLPTSINVFTFVSESLVLATAGTALYMINTTNYTLVWSREMSRATVVQTVTMPAGSMTNMALLLANAGGFRSVDAATGQVMWDSTAKAICPFASPAPGYAVSFLNGQYQLGPLPPGGELFVFAVTCWYGGVDSLFIFGWMNATDGAVTMWRYLSYVPAGPPTPIGSSYFMLPYNYNSASEYFYESSSMTLAAEYPPCCWCQNYQYRASVQGADVIFILQCGWQATQVSAVTIAN